MAQNDFHFNLINSIVKHKKSYWMITSNVSRDGFYPVIKCSKNGKTYREKSGLSIKYIFDTISNETENFVRGGGSTEPAKIDDGIESGKRKRRIQFLQSRIKADTDELLKLQRIQLFSKT